MASSAKILEAFTTLGLQEGSSLDLVKTTYKQVALRTHPDKNPNNPAATEEFQRVGEAYRLLLKHFDHSSRPEARFPDSFSGFPAYSHYGYSDRYTDEDDYDSDIYAHEYEDSESEDDLAFYLWLFQKIMEERSGSHRRNAHRNLAPQTRHETAAQHQERVRRSHEEQLAAQERRKRESVARKERAAREREQERLEAEHRQRTKAQTKKAQADAARKSSELRAREIHRIAQEARSSVFVAARNGEVEKVKKGIWENAIDPAGGEIKPGCSDFVKNKPEDPHETLLHIATRNGDLDLVEWLDSHSAEPEERNSENLTAFQLALKTGHLAITKHFLETYPPDLPDSKGIYECPSTSNLIKLALESRDPEHVWLILDPSHKLATAQEIHQAWVWASSDEGLQVLKGERPNPAAIEKAEDIVKLLTRYDTITSSNHTDSVSPSIDVKQPPAVHQTSGPKLQPPQIKQTHYRGRGQGHGRGRGKGRGHGAHSAPSL